MFTVKHPKSLFFVPTPEQCSTMSDDELLEVLKLTPEFSNLVYPTAWHRKYPDLPEATCSNPKEFLKDSPWMNKAYHQYDNGGKIIDIEAQVDKTVVILSAPEVKAVTIQKNTFSDVIDETEFLNLPEILALKEDSQEQLSKVTTPNTSRDDS